MGETSSVLLLTDVVDSTLLNESIGDEGMRVLWHNHDVAARERMTRWRGREIARSDGFLVLFDGAADAVAFALDYHKCLCSFPVPFQARIGIHMGEVRLRQNSEQDRLRGAPLYEVDGIALPITARVMAAAMGRQTLITQPIATALHALGYRVSTHGHWQFKGVAEPVELLEVGDADSPFEPPPDSAKAYRVVQIEGEWAPVGNIQNNLPAERNDFIGRSRLLARLVELLEHRVRLATLVGMGGVGKTRLALRYARARLGEFPGGVYFCDLSAANSLDGIAHVAAEALNVVLAKLNVVDFLGATIKGRGRCLIILDNFEQIASLAEDVLGKWLEQAPEAHFIVTSREVLAIPGEQTFFVPPMEAQEGRELFEARARGVADSFVDSRVEDAAIGVLVELLDGLPLAIELAAARVRVMPPSALLRRMHERFTLLTTPGRPLSRQATLRATLDWSWDLLHGFERSALAQLTVFEGGFQLEAAEAVIDVAGPDASISAIDAVQSLVDKSLVRRLEGDRLNLLVTVRSYVVERLQRPGSGLDGPALLGSALDRHRLYYSRGMEGMPVPSALRELDNIVASCRHAAAAGDTSQAISALENAWTALKVRGPLSLAVDLVTTIERSGPVSDAENARLHRISGYALNSLGRSAEARKHFDEGLECAIRSQDLRSECRLRCSIGDLDAAAGHMLAALDQLEIALDLARRLKNPELQSLALNSLGDYHSRTGQLDLAYEHFAEALVLARQAKSRRLEGGILGNLGMVRTAQGQPMEALQLYEDSLAVAREIGDRSWEGNALCNLGMTSQALGRVNDATSQLQAALHIARALGQRRLQAFSLCNLGMTLQSIDQPDDAVRHFDQALEIASGLGDRRLEGQCHVYAAAAIGSNGRHDEAIERVCMGESLLEFVGDPVSLGWALARRAEIEHLAGRPTASQATLRRAEEIALTVTPSLDSEFGRALSEVRTVISSSRSVVTQI